MWVLSRWRKVDKDSAEVTSSGRSFHVRGPTTGKARLVSDVVNLTGGTARRLVPAERRGRRQTSGRRSWVDQGIAVRVRARLICKPERRSCTELAPARATIFIYHSCLVDVSGNKSVVTTYYCAIIKWLTRTLWVRNIVCDTNKGDHWHRLLWFQLAIVIF